MPETPFSPESLCVLGSVLAVRELPLCPELRLWLLRDDVDYPVQRALIHRLSGRCGTP